MDKSILSEYIDAIEIIKETELELKLLKATIPTVKDSVSGSSSEYPYTMVRYEVEGTDNNCAAIKRIERQRKLLEEQKEKAEELKLAVEEFKLSCPLRIQRIIQYKYIDGLSWQQVARKFGRSASADGLRKELNRYLKKNKVEVIDK